MAVGHPCCLGGVRASPVVFENKGSSSGDEGDMVSHSGPKEVFCVLP